MDYKVLDVLYLQPLLLTICQESFCGFTVSFLAMSDVSVFTSLISSAYCQARLFFSAPTSLMPILLAVSSISDQIFIE